MTAPRKMVCAEKTHLEKIIVLKKLRDLPEFLRSVRKIMGLRYEGIFADWMEWISRQDRRPTETEVVSLCRLTGLPRSNLDEMGTDVWNVLVLKLEGDTAHITDHVEREGGSPALRASLVL